MQKKWIIERSLTNQAEQLAETLGVSVMVADMLLRRGIAGEEQAKCYVDPVHVQPFYNPYLLKDMDKAVSRIVRAIRNREYVVVYGDYDMDGMTATAVLLRQLRRLGAKADYFVPLRESDGYGLHMETLERIKQTGVELLISVDCGITALAEVKAFREDFDFIITDHHLPEEKLPEAMASINPKQADDEYPDKNIAGVGVAFKLCQALWEACGKGKFADFTMDLELVAMGTIADMVPLLQENRKLAAMGLQSLKKTEIPGLKALLKEAGIAGKSSYDAEDISFRIAPRFNAVGRMDSASKGVRLLLTEDDAEAAELAGILQQENVIRKDKTQEIVAESEKMVSELELAELPALVLAGKEWHTGIVGLVASRLQEKYYLPVIVIGVQEGIGKGSCRSIKGLHIRDALQACSAYLERFGGHEMAAGITIKEEKIDAFRKCFYQYVREHLRADEYVQQQQISFVAKEPRSVDFDVIDTLEIFKPFGQNNEQPYFACFNIKAVRPILRGEHLFFEADGIKVIGWRMAKEFDLVRSQNVDIVFRPEINEFRGKVSIQLVIQAIRPAKALSRTRLGKIYLCIAQAEKAGRPFSFNDGFLADVFNKEEFLLARDIFAELGLIKNADGYAKLIKASGKTELYASKIYCDYLA